MTLSKLTDIEFAVLGHDTYHKRHWSDEDIRMLHECWHEYQRRGEEMMTLFRPAYSDILTFHEIESGVVSEDDVLLLERAGARIAPDYREVMGKLGSCRSHSIISAVERRPSKSNDFETLE